MSQDTSKTATGVPKARVLQACYGNIVVLSTPQRFAKIILQLRLVAKSWGLAGMLRQYHSLEVCKRFPRFFLSCDKLPKAGVLQVYYGNIIVLSFPEVFQDTPLKLRLVGKS